MSQGRGGSMRNADGGRAAGAAPRSPVVIGHRGACGYVPEHTLASYHIALLQGADYAEPDLVMTGDGVLVARHENEIGGTTDVAEHPEFAARRTTKLIDGQPVTGWFTEDFTLPELKRLRARERIGELRPANMRFDGHFEIPTLEEILALLRGVQAQREARARALGQPPPRPPGVYPETKHPSWFAALGLAMEEPLVRILAEHGYCGRDGRAFLQSFEVGNLKALARLTELPLVQLIDDTGAPWDFTAAGEARTYADLVTPAGLREIATYAQAIGPYKGLLIPADAAGKLGAATTLVRDAHEAGLLVHPWTFRAENHFLPPQYRSPDGATALGSLEGELRAFLELGVDGFFTDHPDRGVRACREFSRSTP